MTTFPKDHLQGLVYEAEGSTLDGLTVLRKRTLGQGRWSIHKEIVFTDGIGHYLTTYAEGATEYQDEEPYEDELVDDVPVISVRPVERVIVDYEPVA